MRYKLSEGALKTHFENDDYIPFTVCFGEEDLDVDRMGLYGPGGNLLEIASSLTTHEIRELTLVHCGKYHLIENEIEAPEARSGIIAIEMPDHLDVSRFELEIFSNGLRFGFGGDSFEYLQCGAVVFGFSKTQDMVSEIYVLGLSSSEIATLIETIEFHIEQKDEVLSFDDASKIEPSSQLH